MIKMRGNKVAVEKVKTAAKTDEWLKMPESEEFVGLVKYTSGYPDLPEGTRVYFGKDFQQIKIKGIDLCVMEETNVVAIDQQ